MVLSENAAKHPTLDMGDPKEQAISPRDETTLNTPGNASVNGDVEEPANPAEAVDGEITTPASKDPEVVLIQDTSFMVQIQAPGVEPFDMPVSSMELVQEIQQVLHDKEETCHRTCFTLQLDGTVLDNYAELKSIDGLNDGSVIKVVEEPYTMREARLHVRHVRDLLKSVDPTDAYNGADCMSLSFLNAVTMGDLMDKKRIKPESMDCVPPEFIMPGSKDRPFLPLHPVFKDQRAPQCLKVLTCSGWNPPPGNRKMHGDLMYLHIVTLEEKKFHVTSSTRGFFVNQSTDEVFNHKAAQPKHLCHSLIELLNQISPSFKRNFSVLLKKRAQKHPFERVPTPYQVYSWLAPTQEHHVDLIRAEDCKLASEEHIPGQTRDWNEELQTTRELPRTNLPERLIRERAVFKIHSDFVAAATRAAMAVIDGNIMAINPGESAKMQMFIWNNIFFSLGFDVKDHYKDFGGDSAAYAAPGTDLQGVKAYASVDAEGLFTLGTVVVDYRGYRVTAQSIIPGILEREQEQSVVYGSIDFGKTVVTSEKYAELLKKTAAHLKIRPHKVLNEKGEEVELLSSVECKGIVGNDNRHYVLDLLRTFPPDVNFLPMEGEELSKAVMKEGFPVAHRHRLVSLRQELIEAFVETRYMAFIKNAAWQFQQMRLKKEADKKKEIEDKENSPEAVKEGEDESVEVEEAKKLVEGIIGADSQSFEDSSKEIVRAAAKAVGSLTESAFDLTFNPDVFQPHVKHAGQDIEKDKQLTKDAAEFLLLSQIPQLVKECLEHQVAPIDGVTLTEALHQRGINLRYLGKFTTLLEEHTQLVYLHSIAVSELVTRTAKHIFNTYMQGVEMMSLANAVSHFLNCFLGSCPSLHVQASPEEIRSKKKNKKKNHKWRWLTSPDNTEWASETPKTLWKKISEETSKFFLYNLECDSVDTLVEKYNIQKACLLRSFCQKMGLQILFRDYNLDSKNKPAFSEDDIVNMFPIVKHVHPKASDAYHFFTSGQTKIQQGFLRDGHELISEALNLLNNVYGPIHPEIAACNKLLARLNYIMGEHQEALAYQQRAVLISERVLGIDHPSTITEYAHLALYCFASTQISSALRLLYRARYLALLCSGENHPEVALIDSNIGLILHAVGAYDVSLKFLEKALQLNTLFFGANSLKVAMGHHLVARVQSCRGDFRTALSNEKEAYHVYKDLLGDDHERTKESCECLKHLTKQAVVLQKKMNEIYKGEKAVGLPPLQIQTPSLVNVLETLNVINGIVFVHLSPEDIEKLRTQVVSDQTTAEAEEGDKSSDSSNSKDDSSDSSDTIPANETADSLKAQAHDGDAPIINGTANKDSNVEVEAAR